MAREMPPELSGIRSCDEIHTGSYDGQLVVLNGKVQLMPNAKPKTQNTPEDADLPEITKKQ